MFLILRFHLWIYWVPEGTLAGFWGMHFLRSYVFNTTLSPLLAVLRAKTKMNYSAGEPHMIFFYTFGQCCWALPSLSWEWCGVVCCGVIPETWTCYTILYHTLLYCNILYYALLYYSISCCTTLHYTTLRYTILLYTILNCSMLYNTILHYTIPYYTILCDYCWRIVVWRALESS